MNFIPTRISNTLKRRRKTFDLWRAKRSVAKAGFWFVDIPRTSSSSIRAELGNRYGPAFGKSNVIEREYVNKQLFPDHVPAKKMREMLGADAWDNLYSFSFVRNPFDRVHSLYHYVYKVEEIPADWSFSDFVECLVAREKREPYLRYYGFWTSMADFLLDNDGTVLVNDIFRFEDRGAGIRHISKQIGFEGLGKVHIQSAAPKKHPYRSSYDDVTREKVAAFYARDLELFDYEF